jgi:hypothetical protein
LVVDDLAVDDFGNWSLTHEGIYYIRRIDGNATLVFYDFGSRTTSAVGALGLVPTHAALSVSADGSQIVFTQLDEDAADIQMVETFQR